MSLKISSFGAYGIDRLVDFKLNSIVSTFVRREREMVHNTLARERAHINDPLKPNHDWNTLLLAYHNNCALLIRWRSEKSFYHRAQWLFTVRFECAWEHV